MNLSEVNSDELKSLLIVLYHQNKQKDFQIKTLQHKSNAFKNKNQHIFEKLRKTIQILNKKISSLQIKMMKQKSVISRNEQLTKDLRELKYEHKQLRAKEKNIENEIYNRIKDKLEEFKEFKTNLTKSLKKSKEKIEKLEKESTKESNFFNGLINDLQKENLELKQKIEIQKENHQLTLKKLQTQNELTNFEKKNLVQKIQDISKEFRLFEEETMIEQSLERQRNVDLEKKIEEVNKNLKISMISKDNNRKQKKLLKKITKLNDQVFKLKNERNEMQAVHINNIEILKKVNTENLEEKNKRIKELEEECQQLRESQNVQIIKSLKEELISSRNISSDLRNEVANYSRELAASSGQTRDIEKENEILRASLVQITDQMIDLSKKKNNLDIIIYEQLGEITILQHQQSRNKEIINKNKIYEINLRRLERKVGKLTINKTMNELELFESAQHNEKLKYQIDRLHKITFQLLDLEQLNEENYKDLIQFKLKLFNNNLNKTEQNDNPMLNVIPLNFEKNQISKYKSNQNLSLTELSKKNHLQIEINPNFESLSEPNSPRRNKIGFKMKFSKLRSTSFDTINYHKSLKSTSNLKKNARFNSNDNIGITIDKAKDNNDMYNKDNHNNSNNNNTNSRNDNNNNSNETDIDGDNNNNNNSNNNNNLQNDNNTQNNTTDNNFENNVDNKNESGKNNKNIKHNNEINKNKNEIISSKEIENIKNELKVFKWKEFLIVKKKLKKFEEAYQIQKGDLNRYKIIIEKNRLLKNQYDEQITNLTKKSKFISEKLNTRIKLIQSLNPISSFEQKKIGNTQELIEEILNSETYQQELDLRIMKLNDEETLLLEESDNEIRVKYGTLELLLSLLCNLKHTNITKRELTQKRILTFLFMWTKLFFIDFENNNKLAQKMITLLDSRKNYEFESTKNLINSIKIKFNSKLRGNLPEEEILKATENNEKTPEIILPKKINFKNKITLIDLPEVELARQLTIFEMKLFQKIQLNELLNKNWSKKDHTLTPNLLNLINRFNHTTLWIVTSILKVEKINNRGFLIKKLLNVANNCNKIGNLNAVMEIIAAMHNASVCRLQKTWNKLSSQEKENFEILSSLLSARNNYAKFRNEIKQKKNKPVIPYIGVYLTDLTFIADGMPDKTKNNLINFSKYRQIANVLKDIRTFQEISFNFKEIPQFQKYLSDIDFETDENLLYDMSLKLEKRDF
ncbi:guanine nucleotide exchange factor [Anaeramoeba flamelloides]|uniref:Guanine nucleotide exchange factor n=1 Tax=Anaeramoeba flamelloides TaxID=1746091 RepID=A0AAV7YDP7_9EUKA|nr:guanine nucleotide exchange factor [Anaeramoeba flamelloides]